MALRFQSALIFASLQENFRSEGPLRSCSLFPVFELLTVFPDPFLLCSLLLSLSPTPRPL